MPGSSYVQRALNRVVDQNEAMDVDECPSLEIDSLLDWRRGGSTRDAFLRQYLTSNKDLVKNLGAIR